jgi:protoporphyrinogen oxidase
MSDKSAKEFAVKELVSMNIIDEDDVIDFHREKVKKAYPAYFGVYDKFDIVKDYLNKISNLYCIGRNGMHRYNNMDHSMKSAIVCVNNIINNVNNKNNIWEVNTDKSYHEVKDEKNV